VVPSVGAARSVGALSAAAPRAVAAAFAPVAKHRWQSSAQSLTPFAAVARWGSSGPAYTFGLFICFFGLIINMAENKKVPPFFLLLKEKMFTNECLISFSP
jgi:hypothetical protein